MIAHVMATVGRRFFPGFLCGPICLLSPAALAQSHTVTLVDERPVAKAIEEVEQRFGLPISYGDTLYVNKNSFVDVTPSVRRDGGSGSAELVFVPKRQSIIFNLPDAPASGSPESLTVRHAAALSAIRSLLDNYRAGQGFGTFTAFDEKNMIHVVSRIFVNAEGSVSAFEPSLDARISIAVRQQPAIEVIEEICRQISLATHRTVDVGTVPVNLLAIHNVNINVVDGRARIVLEQLLRDISPSLSWQLLCGPGDGGCALNIHAVPQ